MSQTSFVHLSVHTEYSLVDSVIRIKPLMARLAELEQPAVALTDQSNLFALVKFYKSSISNGIKPIIGVDVWLRDQDSTTQENTYSRVQIICKDNVGYRNMTELVSLSYLEGQYQGRPCVEREWLIKHAAGLIIVSGGMQGDIGKALAAANQELVEQHIEFWTTHFAGHFYIELHRVGYPDELAYVEQALQLAANNGLPIVATNHVRFLSGKDFEAHEARVCINQGQVLNNPRRDKNYTPHQYLKSSEEMIELFKDIPEAIDNTVQIAKRCNLFLTFGESVLPDFPIPDGMTIEQFIEDESRRGLEQRFKRLSIELSTDQSRQYDERLKVELSVINQMGFPGYFLIVADFIQWAKDNGVPVGPGRGSGAGSLVAYALGITDVDPITYDLLFERFLNPERVSMPDFDVDFCMVGRDRVIDYVAEQYGRDQVSQIITYGTMAAKAVVRDVGRVLGHPYGFVDRIAKMIPFEIGITLDKALKQEVDLKACYDDEEEVRMLIDLALQLEGLARNAGKHAGGVVIGPERLTAFTPLYCETGSQNLVTQLDKDDVEAIGLVKFDFLGLRTLTIIDWAIQEIKRNHQEMAGFDILSIALDDVPSFKLLCDQKTTAVFQLESRGMRELIKRLQPDTFEDIVALVALYRPGPLQSGMVDDFINRKHGREKIQYPHPDLENILKPTYGVILYQEQVMQIAQVLADFTLGGADMLRRAMGKKKFEEMAKQRDLFVTGAKNRGVDEDVATYIFDLMEKFAGYGFNKSHSVAYALLAYQTAWLKAHYPSEFMASVLSADMDHTDKIVTLIEETRNMEITVIAPDVNRSFYRFATSGDATILYGMGAIKGVGEAAIQHIVDEREENGPYGSLQDFCSRTNKYKMNKRVFESLVTAGAMDTLADGHRAYLLDRLPEALKQAEQELRDSVAGQNDLFGMTAAPVVNSISETKGDWEQFPRWSDDDKLSSEKQTLGLYLTGHPIMRFRSEIAQFCRHQLKDIAELQQSVPASNNGGNKGGGRRRDKGQDFRIAGLIAGVQTRTGKRGRMGFISLDDRTARLEISCYGEEYEQLANELIKDKIVVMTVNMSYDDFSGSQRLRARDVFGLDEARLRFARYIEISLDRGEMGPDFIQTWQTELKPYLGGVCPVVFKYRNQAAAVELKVDKPWWLNPNDDCLAQLEKIIGEGNWHLHYQQ